MELILFFLGIFIGTLCSYFVSGTVVFSPILQFFFVAASVMLIGLGSWAGLLRRKVLKGVFILLFGIAWYLCHEVGHMNTESLYERSFHGEKEQVMKVVFLQTEYKNANSIGSIAVELETGRKLLIQNVDCEYQPGYCGKIRVAYAEPPNKRNFGDMDYRRYLAAKGVWCFARYVRTVSQENVGVLKVPLEVWPLKLRAYFEGIIDTYAKEPTKGVIKGIVLGDGKAIDPEIMADFRDGGVAHVLSVSGLHISYFFLLLLGIFRMGFQKTENKRQKEKLALWGALGITFGYVLMTGFQSPAVRSYLMIAGKKLGNGKGGMKVENRVFFGTGMVMLLWNPFLIYDLGFLISFACIFSMGNIRLFPEKVKLPLRDLLTISIGAWVGSLPLIWWSFGRVSIIGVLANLPIIPLAGACTVWGVLTLLIASASSVLGGLCFMALNPLVNGMSAMAAFFGDVLPQAVLPRLPFGTFLGLCTFILYFGGKKGHRKEVRGIVFTMGVFAIVLMGFSGIQPGRLDIDFLDVGQGDSAFVQFPGGKTMLIDGGPDLEKLEKILFQQGVFRVDYVLLTHGHEDHSGGVKKIIQTYRPINLLLSAGETPSPEREAIKKAAEEVRAEIIELKKGDCIKIGKTRLLVLLAGDTFVFERDKNGEGLVFLIDYGAFDCLFTADTGIPEERLYVPELVGKKIEVLKVPHHGSKGSSGEELVKGIRPASAVISVGRNFYGHPAPSVIKAYQDAGTKLLRTDEHGGIRVRTNGDHYRIYTVR